MALGGRPKEEGGHKPLKISVNKFVREALEKVGNKSQFLESVARPVLEKMDPGEGSVFLWKIDVYISQGIIVAAKEGNFSQVQALGWLASLLEDARKLCGIPQLNGELKEKLMPTWGKQVWENLNELLNSIANKESLELIPEATVLFLRCGLPSHIKDKFRLDIEELERRIEEAEEETGGGFHLIDEDRERVKERLGRVATRFVPSILDKVASCLEDEEKHYGLVSPTATQP